ncbi:hypothetical protein OAQ15_01120 [Flavobacteriaceae bacterium]|jgi:hypothetical protein|nr:hypothetical protein [Flavobacteriaceae bacterium]
MKEWFKKYLGWLGFGTLMACTLLFALDKFLLKNTFPINEELLMVGFLIMGAASTIQDIINDKYFTKYSDKVKNGIIVFIATSTIGISYFLIS